MAADNERELRVNRLGGNVLVIKGNYFDEHMTAIVTGEGLVVIDTLTTVKDTRRGLDLIEEFSSEPVRFLVNTHFDLDHYAGNQLFRDAVIIGQQNCKHHFDEVMYADPKNIEEVRKSIRPMEEKYKTTEPGSREAEIWKRYVTDYRVLLDGFEGYSFTPPNLYVPGDINIELGEKVIELKYSGPGHTNADIIVLIPGERIMITGDLVLGKGFLPVIHHKHGGSITGIIRILRQLLKMKDSFDTIVPGHGAITDFSALTGQLAYLETLDKAVRDARKKNLTLSEAKEKIKLEKYKYYWLYDFVHAQNIEIAWNEQ